MAKKIEMRQNHYLKMSEDGEQIAGELKKIVDSELFRASLEIALSRQENEIDWEKYPIKVNLLMDSPCHYVDCVMTMVRTQFLLGQITLEQLKQIVAKETIEAFLSRVHVRSKPKSDLLNQEAFWDSVLNSCDGPRGSTCRARNPISVLWHQRLCAVGIILECTEVLAKNPNDDRAAAVLHTFYKKLEQEFRDEQLDSATLRLIVEPERVRVFLYHMIVERAEFWKARLAEWEAN